MKLRELTSVFSNDTFMKITNLTSAGSKVIYEGRIYKYGEALKNTYPDIQFKDYDVVNVEVKDGGIDIVIDE